MKTESEKFVAPWPAVLAEMKDFLDLWFLVRARARPPSAVRIFISKGLVGEAELQPHVRRFRASLAGIPDCRIELKATAEAAHRIDIEYGR
jgi:hypothetical protein